MLKREKRSAIVVTSSVYGATYYPGVTTYSCTKTFADFLGQGLNFELKDKIDSMSWQCGTVSTNMLPIPKGGLIISVRDAVKGMLRDIGRESVTHGMWKHSFLALAGRSLPQKLLNWGNLKFSTKVHKKQVAKGVAEKK